MRDIKESYEEAIELVIDELTPSVLEEVLFADMPKELPFYPLFEDALNEASDNENTEEQLNAMSYDISREVVRLLEETYGIFDRKYVKKLEAINKALIKGNINSPDNVVGTFKISDYD